MITSSRPHLLRRSCAAAVAASSVVLLVAPGRAGAQDPVQPPALATVLQSDDLDPMLAVESYGVVDEPEPALIVRFAEPFDLPDVAEYRIDLNIGLPGEDRQRVAFVAQAGVPTGAVEVGSRDEWESTGAVEVEFDDGVLTMGLPEDLRDTDGDLAWVDVALVADEGGNAATFTTPLVPAHDVLIPSGPGVAAAPLAWGSVDEQPPPDPVDTGDAPQMRIEDDELIITYSTLVPTEVDDMPVESVADVVRITTSMADGASAPYLLAIDHSKGSVTLLDGTNLIPAEVPNDGTWLIDGYPSAGVVTGTEIRASLSGVLDVFGLESDDPATDDELGLGIARSVRLDDSTSNGRVLRADGVVAASSWLTDVGDDTEEAPALGAATTVAPRASGSATTGRRRLVVPALIIACVVALIGIALYLLVRWLEHRRHALATGGPVAPRETPPPTPEEQAMLDDFSRQLFDGE